MKNMHNRKNSKNMKLKNLVLIVALVLGVSLLGYAYISNLNNPSSSETVGGDFDNVIKSKTPVIVDFYADWCKPCRIQAPILEELKSELGNKVIIHKVNVDIQRDIANRYGIQSIPTIMIFKEGKIIWQNVGVQSKETLKAVVLKYQ